MFDLMADIKSPEVRSQNMWAIHSKDTKPELFLRKLLFAEGLRYRKNVQKLPGCPDMYFAKYHTAVFIHGCFWHRHVGCKYAYMPKSRLEFWQKKFESNIKRDATVQKELEVAGIRYLIIWECTIRNMEKNEQFKRSIVSNIQSFLNGTVLSAEL